MSLGVRLLLAFLIALLPFLAVEVYNSYALYNSRTDELQKLALQQSLAAAAHVNEILASTRAILGAVELTSEIDPADPAKCGSFLESVVKNSVVLSSIAVSDLEGNLKCGSNLNNQTVNIVDRPYFKDALASSDAVIGVYTVTRGDKTAILPIAISRTDSSGNKTGVIVGAINLTWLSQHINERGYAQDGSVTIAGRDGIILARQPLSDQFVGTSVPSEFLHLLQDHEPGNFKALSRDGRQRIYGYVPLSVPPRDLYVSTGLSTDLAYAALRGTFLRQLATIIGLVLVTTLIALLANRNLISRPVSRILSTVTKWQAGDLSARTMMRSADGEFGKIGEQFDQAVSSLAAHEQAVALLLGELKHRAKNQITLTLAFARQIARHEKTVSGFAEALERRLQSLAASQDLLLNEPSERVEIRQAIAAQLETFDLSRSDQIAMSGPPVVVDADTARHIGMAIPELLTNAQKHGALRVDDGTIAITWGSTETPEQIYLEWRERHDRPMSAPKSDGFGRVMIEKLIPRLLNGQATLSMTPPGLRWRILFFNSLSSTQSLGSRS